MNYIDQATLRFAGAVAFKGDSPLDAKLLVDTKADLKAVSDEYDYSEGSLVYCKEDESYYQFKATNTEAETGFFKKIELGGGSTASVDLSPYLKRVDADTLYTSASYGRSLASRTTALENRPNYQLGYIENGNNKPVKADANKLYVEVPDTSSLEQRIGSIEHIYSSLDLSNYAYNHTVTALTSRVEALEGRPTGGGQTYNVVTSSENGLMSPELLAKLNGYEATIQALTAKVTVLEAKLKNWIEIITEAEYTRRRALPSDNPEAINPNVFYAVQN